MNTILMSLIIMTMTYEMPKLPYANNALEPVISQQTIDFHYGKHLQTYVNNLNSLVPGTEYEGKTVEEIVAAAPDGAIFNNAGQVLNHNLYFLQFAPKPSKKEPAGKLGEAIKRDFGSFENFKMCIRDRISICRNPTPYPVTFLFIFSYPDSSIFLFNSFWIASNWVCE